MACRISKTFVPSSSKTKSVKISGAVFPVRLVMISSTFLSFASCVFSVPLYAPSMTITIHSSCLYISSKCFWKNRLSLWLFCSYRYSVTTEPFTPTDSPRLVAYPPRSFPALFSELVEMTHGSVTQRLFSELVVYSAHLPGIFPMRHSLCL